MPPVVEVVDGVVTVPVPAALPPSVLVLCGTVLLLLMPDVPPPPPPVDELEESVDDAPVLVVCDLVAAGGVAAPVVGTVSVGAPAVLLDAPPLPPQAAITNAAAKAATVAIDLRQRRLLMSCGNLPPGGSADRLRGS